RRARIPEAAAPVGAAVFSFSDGSGGNWMRALILGRGHMGRAIRDALVARGDEVVAIVGRSTGDARPPEEGLAPVDVAFEFSHGEDVLSNVRYALATGTRAIVLGTTAWSGARADVTTLVTDAGATL